MRFRDKKLNSMPNALYDCREDYDVAVQGLVKTPNNRQLQHQAVLALARAGSLEKAKSEYERFGLWDAGDNEDYLSLAGRLLKDEYHLASGNSRLALARLSAEKYQFAHERTGGFYSGINAATMTLLGGGNAQEVSFRARVILRMLPKHDGTSNEDLYFVEATRCEASLLLREEEQAAESLRRAWAHDPLNYLAHASTLRQLRMICSNQGSDPAWLEDFSPPKSLHFAGQIFSVGDPGNSGINLSSEDEESLRAEISNALQKIDAGFGYGALSAGSDILIAECLLEEGAELHVVLPVEVDAFCDVSVSPFGHQWNDRFRKCLDASTSLTVVSRSPSRPVRGLNRYAGKIAMGQTILGGDLLAADKMQLLLSADWEEDSFTSDHRSDWRDTGYGTVEMRLPARYVQPIASQVSGREQYKLIVAMNRSGEAGVELYSSVQEAAACALNGRDHEAALAAIGIACGYCSEAAEVSRAAKRVARHALPGGILVSDQAASILATKGRFELNYFGRISPASPASLTAYSLARKPIPNSSLH